jgi:hypothetical protein
VKELTPLTVAQIIHGQELIFDEKEHAYTWGGTFVPGVTTILKVINKPALIQWSANMACDHFLREIAGGREDLAAIHKEAKVAHRKKSKAAADSGTNVHEYAEAFFKKHTLPELKTDDAKRGVEAFHKWLNAHKVKVVASERRVFSKEHFFAGTCDFVAEVDGVMSVGDIKTSSGIYPEMRLQTAAYQHALQEEKNMKFEVRWIVRFDKKTGEFEAKPFYDFDLDFKGFCAALALHKTLQAIEGK